MAKGDLIGFDEEKLLAVRTKAEQAYLDGESVMNYAAEGVSVNKRRDVSVQEALRETAFALFYFDNVKYAKYRPFKRSVAFNSGGQFLS